MNPFDHIHFLRLIIYEEMKYRWLLASQIKGRDLRHLGICLHFYDSCSLCWFSKMNSQKRFKPQAPYIAWYFSLQEMKSDCSNNQKWAFLSQCLHSVLHSYFEVWSPLKAWKLHFFPFLFFSFFLRFRVQQMIDTCYSLPPKSIFSLYIIPKGDVQSNTLHT